MPIIQYNDIPATDGELEKDKPYTFTIPEYEFGKFKMKGLSLVDFYEMDRILKIAIYWTLHHEYSKEELKKIILKSSQSSATIPEVIELLDFVYQKIIPVPLRLVLRMLIKHNLKYWRYPSKWLFHMRKFLHENIEIGDLAELTDRFMAYSIQIKKKLESILTTETGSTMNTKEDSATSKRSLPPECAPVCLSAGAQIFGGRKGSLQSKKSGLVA